MSRRRTTARHPGKDNRADKGWLIANKWLIARRFSQLSILFLFLLGPWLDIWLVKGNLNSSLVLDTVPLTDPYVLLQSLFAGHSTEATNRFGVLRTGRRPCLLFMGMPGEHNNGCRTMVT